MADKTKYHINKDTGRPNICRAEPGNCPVGGEHFEDKKEAKQFGEKLMAEKHGGSFNGLSKSKSDSTATKDKTPNRTTVEPTNDTVNEKSPVTEDYEAEMSNVEIAEPVPEQLEDPTAVKVSAKEQAAFKRSLDFDDDPEANDYDMEQLDEAFVSSIGFDTEEHVRIDEYGDEDVVYVPTGDVKPINRTALVDAYYREVSKRNTTPEDAKAAKKVIERVFEKHDMFESYNYSPVVEGSVDSDEEPIYVSSFTCHADTKTMVGELKGIFNS